MAVVDRVIERINRQGLVAACRYYSNPIRLIGIIREVVRQWCRRIEARSTRLIDQIYFNEYDEAKTDKRRIFIWCPAWGITHIEALFTYNLPSMLQEGNIPLLASEGYSLDLFIYTKASECAYLKEKYQSDLLQAEKHMSVHVVPMEGPNEEPAIVTLTTSIIDMIERCIRENAVMIVGGADHIFGNYSLSNAIHLIAGKNVCLIIPHCRVNRESVQNSQIFAEMSRLERTIGNDELVYLALEHGHSTLQNAFDDKPQNVTYGGLSMRYINDNDISVISNRPSVMVANFTQNDLRYFKRHSAFGIWDSSWLRVLCRENRLKVVGSSDIAFHVELQGADEKQIECQDGLLYNDKVGLKKNRRLQNYMLNQVCCLWRPKKIL